MLLSDILTLLANAGVGTKGTDLFIGSAPASPVNCISVLQYGGSDPIHTMGPSLDAPAFEMPRFQVQVRNSSQQTAWTKTRAVIAALRFYEGAPGDTYYLIRQLGDAGEIAQDTNEAFRVVTSWEAIKSP